MSKREFAHLHAMLPGIALEAACELIKLSQEDAQAGVAYAKHADGTVERLPMNGNSLDEMQNFFSYSEAVTGFLFTPKQVWLNGKCRAYLYASDEERAVFKEWFLPTSPSPPAAA